MGDEWRRGSLIHHYPKSQWFIGFLCGQYLKCGVIYLCKYPQGYGWEWGLLTGPGWPSTVYSRLFLGTSYDAGRSDSGGWQWPGPTSWPSNLSGARAQEWISQC